MQPERVGKAGLTEGLFAGTVTHQRQFDIKHHFRYPVWMTLTDLTQTQLPWLLRPQSSKYFDRQRVAHLTDQNVAPDDQIWLLTQPSLVGRSFNPVSFYFVTRHNELLWILAHITNTPWDEDHCYVLQRTASDTWRFEKTFHVSPFLPMSLNYGWRFRVSGDHINIKMQVYEQEQRVFSAVLDLRPRPVGLWGALLWRLKHPQQNVRNLVRIYYQAALLKLKGARFYAHPGRSTGQ